MATDEADQIKLNQIKPVMEEGENVCVGRDRSQKARNFE